MGETDDGAGISVFVVAQFPLLRRRCPLLLCPKSGHSGANQGMSFIACDEADRRLLHKVGALVSASVDALTSTSIDALIVFMQQS